MKKTVYAHEVPQKFFQFLNSNFGKDNKWMRIGISESVTQATLSTILLKEQEVVIGNIWDTQAPSFVLVHPKDVHDLLVIDQAHESITPILRIVGYKVEIDQSVTGIVSWAEKFDRISTEERDLILAIEQLYEEFSRSYNILPLARVLLSSCVPVPVPVSVSGQPSF